MTIVRAAGDRPAETPRPNRQLEGKTILVAEDVEINQRLTRHILESFGAAVIIAANGAEALEKLDHQAVDCILMDIQMPEMDGVEATRHIRRMSDPVRSDVPIIALTANTDKKDLQTYREAGMNDYLAKPVEDLQLLGMILRVQQRVCGDQPAKTTGETESYSASAQGPGSGKPYDLTMIRTIAGGDPAFVRKMILLFAETVPVNVRELIASTHARDWVQVSKLAHKLKSTVDSMGIRTLKQTTRTVEANAKQLTHLEEIPALVAQIDAEIRRCLDALRSEL